MPGREEKINFPTFDKLELFSRFGPRFFPVVAGYSREMREVGQSVARELEEPSRLQEGVYDMVGGPHFETPAEVKLLRALGADLVGEAGQGWTAALSSPLLSTQG